MRAWLKNLREVRNLTQAQVAKHLGITQNYYCEIETGKKQADLNFSTAIKLANIFNISLEDIRKFEQQAKGSAT